MKRIIQICTVLVLAMALLVGCGAAGSDHVMAAEKPTRDASDKENLASWIEKGKELSTRDFEEKTIPEFLAGEENLVYSPANVFIALSMLTEAANGETQDELLSLLGSKDTAALRQKAQAIWNTNYINNESATKLANSLWLNEDVSFREDMLKTYAKEYYASTFFGKMGSSEMDQILQDWINENTGGELQEKVKEFKTDPETLVELMSTIYFRADWTEDYKFEEYLTATQPFDGAGGRQEVQMMTNGFDGSIYRTDQFAECDLDLTEGKMCFFLPKEGVEIEDILKSGSLMEALHRNDEGVTPAGNVWTGEISCHIPKFEIHSDMQLVDGLKELGVQKVFDPATADLTNLFSKEESAERLPFIDKVTHDAMVKINEKGVTAAAYTEIEGAAGAAEQEIYDFRLDRPFLYAITGNDGSILFVGTVYNVLK